MYKRVLAQHTGYGPAVLLLLCFCVSPGASGDAFFLRMSVCVACVYACPSPLVNGLLASASEDGSVRLWDVDGASPSLMGSKDFGVVRGGPGFPPPPPPSQPFRRVCLRVGHALCLSSPCDAWLLFMFPAVTSPQGKLFTVNFYTHSPFLLAAGGESDKVIVWETDMVRAHRAVTGLLLCSGPVSSFCIRLLC